MQGMVEQQYIANIYYVYFTSKVFPFRRVNFFKNVRK